MTAQLAQAILAPHVRQIPSVNDFMPSRWKPQPEKPVDRAKVAAKIASVLEALGG